MILLSPTFLTLATAVVVVVVVFIRLIRRADVIELVLCHRQFRRLVRRQQNRAALLVCRWLRYLGLQIVLIVVIALEEVLDTVAAQLLLTLLDCLRVFPLLVVHMVLIEVVDVDVGHVLRLHLARSQRVPVEVVEPRVRLQLSCTVLVADTVYRLALQTLVDKVCGFLVPTVRNIVVTDLNLSTEDLISDILSCPALVGSLAHHALIGDNTDGEVVCCQAMVLTTHDFRSHIAWRATRLARVIRREDPGHAKISQA